MIKIIYLICIVLAADSDQYQPGVDVAQVDRDVLKWTNIARTTPSKLVPIL